MTPHSEVVQQKEMVRELIASLERDLVAEPSSGQSHALRRKLEMAKALLAEMESTLEGLPHRPRS